MKKASAFLFAFLFLCSVQAWAGGTVLVDSLISTALGKKELFSVYLPQGYSTDVDSTYPSVYFLHGLSGTNTSVVPSMAPLFDSLIAQGKICKMILVFPDGHTHNSRTGCWYTNSILNGNYEDCIVQDIVACVDSRFRTKNSRQFRAIQGHSMGGYGSLMLGMKHSDVFGTIASMSGLTHFTQYIDDVLADNVIFWAKDGVVFTMAAAFSPNFSNPPDSADMPYNVDTRVKVDAVIQKWLTKDCYTQMDSYAGTLRTQNVYLECGMQDEINFYAHAQQIDAKLTLLNVTHTFRSYSGDHSSGFNIGFSPANPGLYDYNIMTPPLKFISSAFTGTIAIRWLPVAAMQTTRTLPAAYWDIAGRRINRVEPLFSGQIRLMAIGEPGERAAGKRILVVK